MYLDTVLCKERMQQVSVDTDQHSNPSRRTVAGLVGVSCRLTPMAGRPGRLASIGCSNRVPLIVFRHKGAAHLPLTPARRDTHLQSTEQD